MNVENILAVHKQWNVGSATSALDSQSRCNLCPKLVANPLTGHILVDSYGSETPRILVVYESPGKGASMLGSVISVEDDQFIDAAFRGVADILTGIGIPKDAVRYTNLVRCATYKPDGQLRSPSSSEILRCSGYLFNEIEKFKPEVIITFGALVSTHLVGFYDSTITSMSGKIFKVNVRGSDYFVVPAVQPLDDLYAHDKIKASIVKSISLAWGLINQFDVPVQSHILNSTWEASSFLENLLDRYNSKEITELALDIEYDTSSMGVGGSEANRLGNLDLFDSTKQLVAISFAATPTEGFCIPLHHIESSVDVSAITPLLRKVITTIPMIVHGFLKAEGPWLREKLGAIPNLHRDTMLMSYAIHMKTRGHGLKPLSLAYLKWGDWSIKGDAWFNEQPPERRSYKYMPLEMMGRYSAIDPAATKGLKDLFEVMIDEEDLWPAYERRHQLSHTLLAIEERGALVDMEMLERVRDAYPIIAAGSLERLSKLPEVIAACGSEFNPLSPQQLVDIIFGELGAPVLQWNPVIKRGQVAYSTTLNRQLLAGSDRIASSVTVGTKYAWLGNPKGQVGSERIAIATCDETGIVLNKPLKYTHDPMVYITSGSPSSNDSVVVRLLNNTGCFKCRINGVSAVCARCSGTGIEPDQAPLYNFLKELRLYKKVKKLSNDYFNTITENLIPGTNRLTINYLTHVTDTGRLAARNMNIHSFPAGSDVRRLFVSKWQEQGGLVSQMDQSQLEMRVLAALTGDQRFIEVFFTCTSCSNIGNSTDKGICPKCSSKLGGDLHKMTASEIFNKPLDEVTKSERRYAKTISFGIVYGASAYLISDQTGISVEDADKMIKRFMSRFSRVASWIKEQHANFEAIGWTKSPLGTKLYFEHFDSNVRKDQERGKRQSQNYVVQSAAAEMVIDALILSQKIMASKMQSRPWETTHDSIVFDLYPTEVLDAIKVGKSCMEELTLAKHPWMTVPLIADVGIGVRWDGDLVVEAFDGDQLKVKGNGAYYDETLDAMRKTYTVKEDIISTYVEDVDDTLTTKSGYKSNDVRTDGVKAIWRLS